MRAAAKSTIPGPCTGDWLNVKVPAQGCGDGLRAALRCSVVIQQGSQWDGSLPGGSRLELVQGGQRVADCRNLSALHCFQIPRSHVILLIWPAIGSECRQPFFASEYLSDGLFQMQNDCLDVYHSILASQEALLEHRLRCSFEF